MRPLIPAALLLAAAACQAADASDVSERPGVWRLIALNGQSPAPVVVTLAFPAPGQLAGQGPCNRYSGAYAGDGAAFRPGALASTEMACDALALEGRYFAALARVDRREQAGDRMVLTGPGTVLEFVTPLY
jgi:heat shock protein HslJ